MPRTHNSSRIDEAYLKGFIRNIPDFPIEGINFKDINPLLADRAAFSAVIETSVEAWSETPIDAVVAVESRGFLLGAPLAHSLSSGLVLVRKPGKLPGRRDKFDYRCEYCSGSLEVHRGLVTAGMNVLVVDDLLATGGTARATADYLVSVNANIVGFGFIVELTFLNGRSVLSEAPVHSVLAY